MYLTKEDLLAISELVDDKLNYRFAEQTKLIDKRLQEQSDRFDQKLQEQSDRFDQKLQEQSVNFDQKLQEQSDKYDNKLENLRIELKNDFEMLLYENNVRIGEHVANVVQDSEKRLASQLSQIEGVVAKNCYDIQVLKQKTDELSSKIA